MINEEGLRDWFGKSKSKDGKKGWVNVVTGDSCASDKPGEGVPKCVSSAKRASMSKKERVAAQAAKRREDPGQQSKSGAAKPTMVKTDRKVRKEDMDINEAKDKKGKGSGKKDACYHKVKSRYSVWPSAYASGALVKCRKKGAKNWGSSTKNEEFLALPEFSQLQIEAMRKNGIEVEVVDEACWKTHEQRGMKKKGGKMVPNCVPKGSVKKEEKDPFGRPGGKHGGVPKKGGGYDKALQANMKKVKELEQKEGYAPGDVDKKVGAVTSIPKDEQEKAKARLLAKAKMKRELAQKIKEDREKLESMDEATYPSDFKNPDGSKRSVAKKKEDRPVQHDQPTNAGRRKTVDEERIPSQNGNVYMVTFSWRGKMMAMKIFFPETRRPSRQEVEAAMDKVYPGCKVRHYDDSYVGQGDGYLNVGKSDVYAEFDEGAAWTKKSGKNPSGGLNEKGRKSYEKENPGSDLKAPSKKVGNPRRKSFCARMKGMKSKLTSKKTASDPDSRINKSLRAWNC